MDGMKVLVADDEERVCALICALIDWKGLVLEKVGTAFDGISALSLIEQKKPDLVITDIRMPGLDGLELIRRAKEVQPHLQFIIISGHKQFDYAQSAIKYGVAEYLLKPIKQIELNQTLSRMKKHYEDLQQSHMAKQQFKDGQTYVRRTAFASFLKSLDVQILKPWLLDDAIHAIAIVSVHGQSSSHVIELLQEKLLQTLERHTVDNILNLYDDTLYILFSFKKEQAEHVEELCCMLMEVLKTQVQIFQDLYCSLALGIASDNLVDSLLSARQAMYQRLIKGHQQCFFAKQLVNYSIEEFLSFAASGFEQLCVQEQCSSQKFVSDLYLLFDQKKASLAAMVESLEESYQKAYDFVKSQNAGDMVNVLTRKQLMDVTSLLELKKKYELGLDSLLIAYQEGREANFSKPIKSALNYLNHNYTDELLSLEQVSEIVNLNSSYFSALFKKRMGQGFSEYVLQLRIQKAKELLVQTNLNIAQIAQRVGYHDPKHFSKLFKKQCQIKPNEYRKLYG